MFTVIFEQKYRVGQSGKKKVKENRLFSLLCASTDTYDMSLYFNVYCFSFSRKIIALYSKC